MIGQPKGRSWGIMLNLPFLGLQVQTLELDFGVTTLEENTGSGGNNSIADLEQRVETLEGTAADHETRISATESDVTGTYLITINN